MLSCQREMFSLPEELHYLNCAYMGPLSKATQAAGVSGVGVKAVPVTISSEDFFAPAETLRSLMGQLVNASPERVALITAVSYGVALLDHNLKLASAQNVVMPAEEFPSNVYSWMDRCRKTGAALRQVPRPMDTRHPGDRWTQALLDAIDADTALVTLTAVHWTDGTRFDLERIGKKAREAGALFVVDGTQSVGALPFDFESVQPDALLCTGYKWLLGPYGLGLMVFGDRLMELEPLEMNWINRHASEDFSQLINYQENFQSGARRYDFGERSNPITLPMLISSLQQVLDWGVENIQEYTVHLGETLDDALAGSPFMVAAKEDRVGHIFGIRLPDAGKIERVMEILQERGVHVSLRGTSVRVSPNIYNTPRDIQALADALKASIA